ncbi:PrsW family intramembrane metalloprotease [candidate division KSB1 bacterium]|nr:PrsW family intramembrane metalloprotease [candidate division KSB1 bacterium]
MQEITRVLVSLIPVILFLAILKLFDSFKLLKMRDILFAILLGATAAAMSYFINRFFLSTVKLDLNHYSQYDAPLIEETLKGMYIFFLIRANRVGFRIDIAIYGFALGAGFALVENIFYLQAITDSNLLLWIVRGFGTAIMHGGTTAIFGILAKTDVDQRQSMRFLSFFPGLAVAMIIHSIFNHFFLPPMIMTGILILTLPILFYLIFQQSERSTRQWLDIGFDTDQELLNIITTDKINDSKIGLYLKSLKESYPSEVILDMICYMRVYLELSIKAKGLLMMREMGFEPERDDTLKPALDELVFLEKSIGRTGMMIVSSFMSMRSQDIWQLKLLAQQ